MGIFCEAGLRPRRVYRRVPPSFRGKTVKNPMVNIEKRGGEGEGARWKPFRGKAIFFRVEATREKGHENFEKL